MIGILDQKPIRFSTFDIKGASLDVAVDQLEKLKAFLDKHGVRYWVRHSHTSYDGGPYQTKVFPRHGTDLHRLQELLDAEP